ncbi:LysR family transcriptional regulator [Xanthomonas oryzae pv. oryzicola]|uniref:LysR family transcriptional regulator n=2 Tax=Xanthomonas oryzae TaxID=347 RepID=UPI000423438C|nr:LysR family transcriptional regulator [Xanthomonas oryzae]
MPRSVIVERVAHVDRTQEMTLFAARAGQASVAAVARRLGISTATVTRTIAQLASRLGALLVVRNTRTMRFTDAGRQDASDCRRLLAELDDVERRAAGLHRAPGGLLTVTAPQMSGALHVTPILTRFLSRYAAMRGRALLVDRVVSMLDEGIDVAVRIGTLPDSSPTAIPVGSVRRMVCASPGYLAEHGTPQHPDALPQHATISTSAAARAEVGVPSGRSRACGRRGVAPERQRIQRCHRCRRGWVRPHTGSVVPGARTPAKRNACLRAGRLRDCAGTGARGLCRRSSRLIEGAHIC